MLCCIIGCSNSTNRNKSTDDNIKFYKFPKDSSHYPWFRDKRQKWLNAVKQYVKHQGNWSPSKNTIICSAHFIGNEKSEHPLNPSYIPSIFPGAKSNPKSVVKKNQRKKRPQIGMVQAKVVLNSFKEESTFEVPVMQSVSCQKDDSSSDKQTLEQLFFCTLINFNGVCTAEIQTNIVLYHQKCEAKLPTPTKVKYERF